jgi:transcriptional regulator with XRE-family HTH domain
VGIRKVLAKNVRRLLAKRGISMEQLAYENDISKGYAYEILNAKANVSLLILEKLAKALKVKPKDLLS